MNKEELEEIYDSLDFETYWNYVTKEALVKNITSNKATNYDESLAQAETHVSLMYLITLIDEKIKQDNLTDIEEIVRKFQIVFQGTRMRPLKRPDIFSTKFLVKNYDQIIILLGDLLSVLYRELYSEEDEMSL